MEDLLANISYLILIRNTQTVICDLEATENAGKSEDFGNMSWDLKIRQMWNDAFNKVAADFLLRNVKSALLSVIICRQKYEEAKSSI